MEKELFMKEALKEAKKAFNKEEIPIGVVIVKDNKIISRAHNLKESKKDTTEHAEIRAIKKVYIGTMDEKTGAVGSKLNLFEDYTFNHKVDVERDVLKEECKKILQDFFKELRKSK